ncbi:unnamed protein product [Rotaria socialis]|uniref:G-protein coupled receptors family 1 profile domain-containing protein n=1 Tax=Rotaria socialis TaxID=392032 RepID=A0A820UWH3_9BILA|nr:unnamed protein product [Rotaria socialis]CAF3476754.1 unnamed protein product [Rotaria socialis]CAF3485778.1 unnamed protein product [Rotaria socialis]CAF3767848.1 unnamed protein product [Rotaria socialis]CAF4132707.1 unnamed protein product [Rotaria socialis]
MTSSIASLKYTMEQLNRYLALAIFIFGSVGNILNCLVLSQRKLRSHPCAAIFLASSFLSLICILIGVPPRMLTGWNVDPTNTIHIVCKLYAFIVFSTRTMAIWLITLATIDRWLISSTQAYRRRMSNMENVKRAIFIIVILSSISYCYILYCFAANIIDAPMSCYGKTGTCRLVTDLMYTFVTTVIPLILMIIFGVLTVSNVRNMRSRVRVHYTVAAVARIPSTVRIAKLKTIDHKLLRMLIIQILLLIVLCIPQPIQELFITLKPPGSGSEYDDALNTFLYNIELLIAFIANGIPFYIYTLAGGKIFRTTFLDTMKSAAEKIICE